ncbi:MAG: glycine betaine ABC transporter substrate-binding protein [Anaerostipes sp.]|jgi:osmoprotectant transport system permease protein|nr:glycine betaine ABC transporter substrate-binding protein [Anaerostipes sp.]MDD3746945.1 glycine betaine ABC transporter substrate-binding protein [Anaerostipes sp.]
MSSFFQYVISNKGQIISLLLEHIQLTAVAVLVSICIGVPLGILISYIKNLGKPIMGLANVVQAIPSMALLGLSIPLLGIGTLPAVVMVTIYSLLPIIKNTYTGIQSISPNTVEAAKGIGLTKAQVLLKVEIPLALPIIMAGVRISAVTAVGLMTMAAFIGAGGLGYLVFSGIRTVNNMQILAGAIPSCLLALFVDYIFGIIEKLVTPISLQSGYNGSKEKIKAQRRRQKGIITVVGIIVVALLGNSLVSSFKKEEKSIAIGSKDFTEQIVLCNLYADVIEAKTDIHVDRRENLGGSEVCYEAVKKGEIDMYMEYTGTAYMNIMKEKTTSDMNKVYREMKSYFADEDLSLLDQTQFNNTYTLAVTKKLAKQYHLENISDLKGVASKLKTGTTLEFLNRADGLPGLCKNYNLKFSDSIGVDGSPRYTALENGKVDVVDAFATDGLLKKFKLVVLKDDKNYFPPYYAVPVLRDDTLKKYPELKKVINDLSKILTDDVMSELNYQVDELGKEPKDVSKAFLKKQGIIK